jgi:tripartite-type tricarboxylate transporter receptor subunit TctC
MHRRSLFGAMLGFLAARRAKAQAFPSRPIRLVIPYPAGGTTDVMARALQGPLQQAFNQPVVIDNRGGGAGAIGMNEVAHAAPDGRTLVISNIGPTSILPALQPNVGYDGLSSFEPISLISTAPLVVVVHPSVPATDLAGFIRYARSQPGKLSYASAGVGSLGHLSSVLFTRMAGIEAVHVPYRGQAATSTAVMAGETQFLISTSSSAMSQLIGEDKLRLLAVTTPEPSSLLPGVPGMRDVLPGYSVAIWFGLLAPARSPAPVVQALNRVVVEALAAPDIDQQFRRFGQLAGGSSPEVLRREITAEIQKWRKLIEEAGIRQE